MPLPIIPLIGAAASLGGGFLNFFSRQREGKLQREQDMKMAEYSYSKDLEMWNRQNEYNTPENQMQRFKTAGLNPHLIYGKGTPGNAQQMPKYNKPDPTYPFHPFQVPNIIGQYQDFRIKEQQIDNMKVINQNLKSENVNRVLKNRILGYTDRKAPSQFAYDMSHLDAKNRMLDMRVNKMLAESNITETKSRWLKLKMSRMKETNINIDRDNIIPRLISDILGKEVLNSIRSKKKMFQFKGQ